MYSEDRGYSHPILEIDYVPEPDHPGIPGSRWILADQKTQIELYFAIRSNWDL